jgi:hypothetical protein
MTAFPLNGAGAHLEAADVTAPKIFRGRRLADRRKYRPVFVLNPASGTLKISVHLRLKVENARWRGALSELPFRVAWYPKEPYTRHRTPAPLASEFDPCCGSRGQCQCAWDAPNMARAR